MKFCRKTVEVEAEQYSGDNNPFGEVESHQCDYRMCPICGGDNKPTDYIKTRGGFGIVKPGYWIIKNATSDFESYSADSFSKLYEPSKSFDLAEISLLRERVKELEGAARSISACIDTIKIGMPENRRTQWAAAANQLTEVLSSSLTSQGVTK